MAVWLCVGCCGVSNAQPVLAPWPGPSVGTGERWVGAAALGGLWCTSDGRSVDVRDIRQSVRRSLTLSDFATVIPGLDTGTSAIGGVAMSDSGRLMFVAVQRPARSDTLTSRSDEIVRVDTETGTMSRFATFAFSNSSATYPSYPMVHTGGKLYLGGLAGLLVYNAGKNDATGVFNTGVSFGGSAAWSMAFDRVGAFLFVSLRDGRLLRFSTANLSATSMGSIGINVTGLAFCDHYSTSGGLFLGGADGQVRLVPASVARGASLTISNYTTLPVAAMSTTTLAAGCDGSLLAGRAGSVYRMSDAADPRLGFDAWVADEIRQQVVFGKSLISPQGEPAGWVIDGNVTPGGTLFHPATPDGAAWVVLQLIASDELFADPEALPLVRLILKRYAGQLAGPVPSRTADGIFRHWIDPFTGGAKPGWDPEFALMSTMKIVVAASRAAEHFSQDPEIVSAARSICCSVRGYDSYLNPSSKAMYLKGLIGGGPDFSTGSTPFHEGILFVDQAAFYGGASSRSVYDAWLNRGLWPYASNITGRTVTSNSYGFEATFVSAYPMLLVDRFRNDPSWQSHIANLSSSASAWTDDRVPSPRWFTVFSAGTTKPEWGGYNADSIGNSPGDVTTLTALCALAGRADGLGVREASAAYQAYRTGVREAFRGGSSILYRVSNVDPAWRPGDAGLPDVAMGALGLAEILSPGFVQRVLITGLPVCGSCRADVGKQGGIAGADGQLDNNDFIVFIDAYFNGNMLIADVGSQGGVAGGDGMLDNNDFVVFIDVYFSGC